MNLGKIKSMLTDTRNDIISFLPIKGAMLKIDGNGASDPTIAVEYNILSAVRTGVGVYRITIKQATVFGVPIGQNSVVSIDFIIAPNVTSELYSAELVIVSTTEFDLVVKEGVVGGGSKLEFNPYDILSGDTVSIMSMLSLGNRLIGE